MHGRNSRATVKPAAKCGLPVIFSYSHHIFNGGARIDAQICFSEVGPIKTGSKRRQITACIDPPKYKPTRPLKDRQTRQTDVNEKDRSGFVFNNHSLDHSLPFFFFKNL